MSDWKQVMEEVLLRGIQGQLEDHYILKLASGCKPDEAIDFMEAKYMAEQVYASWHKGWTR